MPPTDQNDAVLTYDSTNKIIVAVVKITEGEDEAATHRLETWAYDAGANKWAKMNPEKEPDPSGSRARVLVFAPEFNVAIMENRTHRSKGAEEDEQQILAYRFADAKPKENNESEDSIKVRAQPRIVEDAIVSVISPERIELSWKASEEKDVIGYHVERAIVEVFTDDQLNRIKSRTPTLEEASVGAIKRIGRFERITDSLIKSTTFTDTTVDLTTPQVVQASPIYERSFYPEHLDESGKPYRLGVYAYRIYAVNALGLESGDSPAFFTIPSAPQFFYAKEDGTTCELKWAANPEKNIQGYRIYRMDGRWDKDKITRLTPEPLNATTYSDQQGGESTRRYYVVAVDAMGQEGFTSSPVWFNQEWKRFYEPFTGEWHQ